MAIAVQEASLEWIKTIDIYLMPLPFKDLYSRHGNSFLHITFYSSEYMFLGIGTETYHYSHLKWTLLGFRIQILPVSSQLFSVSYGHVKLKDYCISVFQPVFQPYLLLLIGLTSKLRRKVNLSVSIPGIPLQSPSTTHSGSVYNKRERQSSVPKNMG